MIASWHGQPTADSVRPRAAPRARAPRAAPLTASAPHRRAPPARDPRARCSARRAGVHCRNVPFRHSVRYPRVFGLGFMCGMPVRALSFHVVSSLPVPGRSEKNTKECSEIVESLQTSKLNEILLLYFLKRVLFRSQNFSPKQHLSYSSVTLPRDPKSLLR